MHLWSMRDSPYFSVLLGDAHGYDAWAQQIAAGDWIGREGFYQAPLYPYFLGLIYSIAVRDLFLVRIVQVVIGSLSCLLLAGAASRLLSRPVGIAAGAMLALYAPAIFFDALIQKTVLDVFFISLAIWLLSRAHEHPARFSNWLWVGVTLGCLSLTRENALLLAAVVFVWMALHFRHLGARRLMLAGALSLGLAIVLLPVATRNKAVGGGFNLTTSQFGPNFYIGNNERADGTYMSLRFGRGAPEYERQDATELAERAVGRRLTPSQVSDYWARRAVAFITTHPLAWLRLTARKFMLVWNAREVIDTESLESHAEWSPVLRATARIGHFGVLVPLALFGVMVTWTRRRELWLLYALLVTYTASVVMFYVFARYRFPMVPFLVLFAAAGLVELRGFGEWWHPALAGIRWRPALAGQERTSTIVRGASPPRRAIVLPVVAIVVVFCNWPLLSPTVMQAVSETNLGTGLQAAGRLDEAIHHYRRATELNPNHASAYTNMGTALRLQGRVDEAIATYRRALELQPAHVDAQYNLANALLEKGDASQAVEQFQRALARQPDSVEIYNNLGIAYDALGRHEEALRMFQKAIEVDPGSAEAHYNLGNALSARGALDAAAAEFRLALQINPDHVSAHYDLGNTLLAQGRFDDAVAHLRQALALSPSSVEAHNNLGIALGSQGKFDAALGHFREALRLNPDFEEAKQNLSKLLAAEADLTRTKKAGEGSVAPPPVVR